MSSLRIVNNVQQAWNQVEPLLSSAMVHSAGEYTLDQLKVMLVEGSQTLLVLVDDTNKIQAACTISWVNHPNDKIAYITSIGGKLDSNSFNQLKDWAKANGGTKVRGAAFESVARLWKIKFKFKKTYTIVECEI